MAHLLIVVRSFILLVFTGEGLDGRAFFGGLDMCLTDSIINPSTSLRKLKAVSVNVTTIKVISVLLRSFFHINGMMRPRWLAAIWVLSLNDGSIFEQRSCQALHPADVSPVDALQFNFRENVQEIYCHEGH